MKHTAHTHETLDAQHRLMSLLGLLGVCLTLLIAFYYQFVKHELPCPLCLLQRVGLIIAGLGFLFNLRLGIKGTHYAMVLFGALLTSIIAARQVLLHIAPGDPGYGSDFIGLHFYTWALISSMLIIAAVAIMLIIGDHKLTDLHWDSLTGISKAVGWFFAFLIAANLVSTFLECGTGQCADNPTKYELLDD